jgi:hypothetical protein
VIFPDSHATYWRIALQIQPDEEPRLRIEGALPKARYMGFSLYRMETGNSIASLSDEKIVFEGNNEQGQSTYTVRVLPRDAQTDSPNVIRYPKPYRAPLSFELWYRVYLPEDGTGEEGGVELPTVEALGEDGAPVSCPQVKRKRAASSGTVEQIPPFETSDAIRFQTTSGRTTSSNPDSHYVVARLQFTMEKEVAVFRARPPQVVRRGEVVPTGPSVRYWSMCLSGVSGEASACVADSEAILDSTGWVNVVVGPESMETAAVARGFNFIPRGKLFFPGLLYRTMLARSQPELPTGRLLSVKSFLSEYAEVSPIRTPGLTKVAAPGVPEPAPDTIRFGIARDLFLGDFWNKILTRAQGGKLSHEDIPMGPTAQKRINEKLSERTGLTVEVSLLSTDTIAAALDRGALDFALVPGFEYSWIRRFYPRIDPVAHGVGEFGEPGTTRAHLMALPQTGERLGGEPGHTPLKRLKGARLAIYPARSEALFALYRGLMAEGENPEGFFNLPLVMNRSLDNALDCLEDSAIDHTTGKIGPCADLLLIDDNALEDYRKRYPSWINSMDLLWSSPPIPLPMVLYSSLKPPSPNERQAMSGLVYDDSASEREERPAVKGFADLAPLKGSRGDLIRMVLRQTFGFSRFALSNEAYMDVVEEFEGRMREFPEFFLPLSFFPRGSFERR